MIKLALYRRIQTTFWTDTKVVDDFTPEDKYFYLYLFTNPHTNLCGCYEISIKQMSNETGYSKDTVERLIERFTNTHKVIDYSVGTKELLLVNWHKYNWTKSPKYRKSLNEQISEVKNSDFQQYLKDLYNSIDTVSIQYGYGIDTVTNTNTTLDKKEKKEYKDAMEEAIKGINKDLKDCNPPVEDFDIEESWWKIVKVYPKSKTSGSSSAKKVYIRLFDGALYPKEVANTVVKAIRMYLDDYRENNENEKYVKTIGKWFEEDLEYWFREATEIRNSQRGE